MTDEPMAMPVHGEFCWTEIASTDLERCRTFYSNVFGWEFKKSQATGEEMEYLEFSSSGEPMGDGALYEMQAAMFGGNMPPAHIAHYVSVDDVNASVEMASQLGGKVVFPPYDIPNVGRMAVIEDPTGAMVSIITLNPM